MRLAAIMLALLILLTGCAGAAEPTEAVKPTSPETQTAPEPTMESTEAPSSEPAPEPTETEPPEQRYTLTFAGDCTLGCQPGVVSADMGFVKTIGEDYGWCFRNVQQWFSEDDFTFVNLEGVLSDRGVAVPKTHNLRGPAAYTAILTQGSVEAVSLANNHIGDYGEQGIADTKAALEAAGVPYVEARQTLLYTTPTGLNIGIYAEAYGNLNLEGLKAAVSQLREAGAEVIVCAVHWGVEYDYYPQPHHMDYAHQAVDAGVDIVIGHHPHVLQYSEIYNGKPIFYSLGNFAFGGNTQPRDLDSAMVQVEVIRSPEGEVSLGEIRVIPVRISSTWPVNNYQPTPYEEGSEEYQRVLDKLAGLWKGKNGR